MIRRLKSLLPRLLAILLITQGVAAPAHCLELLARSTATPICTGGDGLRYGQGVRDDDPLAHHGADGCTVCHALPQGPVPQGPQLPLPASVLAEAAARHLTPPPAPGRLPSPYAARAPPLA
jgi:hypothetical protein